MITYLGASISLVASLFCLVGSQLLVKWRFGTLGLDRVPTGDWWQLVHSIFCDAALWGGMVLVLGGALLWYAAMTRLPLGLMLPIGASVSPLVAIGAHLLFGERLTLPELVLILVIAGAVALLAVLHART